MADVNKLLPFLKKWEGGFVNDPNDLGGATNMGVTFATYAIYCKKTGKPEPTVADLKKLKQSELKDILKTMYWDVFKADAIDNQNVANICVDWLWMSGKTAIKRVQRLVGVKDDGIVGPKTLAAINSRSPLPLFGLIKEDRKEYYAEICEVRAANRKFLKGWMNRLNDMNYIY